MSDPGAQQPSQMFLTWVKARPQHREFRALLLTNSEWVLKRPTVIYNSNRLLTIGVVRRDLRLIVLIREDLKV